MAYLIDVDSFTINTSAFKEVTNKLKGLEKIAVPSGRQYIKFELDPESLDLDKIQEELTTRADISDLSNIMEASPEIELSLIADYNVHSISGFFDEYKAIKSTRAFTNLNVYDDFDCPSAVRFKTLVAKEADKRIKALLKPYNVIPACVVEVYFDNDERIYSDFIKIKLIISLLQV